MALSQTEDSKEAHTALAREAQGHGARHPDMTAFTGIRVLDLSRVLAGPFCGQMLADFGADVIKVEDVGGDENRKWAPVIDGQSANFLSVNRGKRGMTLNLKSPSGQEILAGLVRKADVVIDSFLPAVAQRLGVDDTQAARAAARPRARDDQRLRPRGAAGRQAGLRPDAAGLQRHDGDDRRARRRPDPRRRLLHRHGDGHAGLFGIASALYARQAGKAAASTSVSPCWKRRSRCSAITCRPTRWAARCRRATARACGTSCLTEAFATRDGHVLAGATNDAAWQRLCAAIGATALATDPALATSALRIENRDTVIPALAEIFATRSTADWVEALDAANVPCAPVNDISQALAHPQIAAMKMVLDVARRDGGSMSLVGVPLNLSARRRRRAPRRRCSANTPTPFCAVNWDRTRRASRRCGKRGAI